MVLSQVTKGGNERPGHKMELPFSLETLTNGEVERSNQTLKPALVKLKKTGLGWSWSCRNHSGDITLEWRGPQGLNPRETTEAINPLTTHVNLSLTWSSYLSKPHTRETRDIQPPTLSLTIRAHLCLQAKRSRHCHFRKNVTCDHNSLANIWTIYLRIYLGIFCLQKRWSPSDTNGQGWRPGHNQTHVKAAGEKLCSFTQGYDDTSN